MAGYEENPTAEREGNEKVCHYHLVISYGNDRYDGVPTTLDLQACEHLLPD